MIKELPAAQMPTWLAAIDPDTVNEVAFPLENILKDSLYYPSSGIDGDPIKYLSGNFFSFIYVDYGYAEDDVMRAFRSSGFRGYDVLSIRSVTEKELTPNGWQPMPPGRGDGNPARYKAWIQKPFCSWTVFQRQSDFSEEHGPARFSLLYLCADGVAAFQALYIANKVSPKAVAVIQPGHAFGGNWTNYTDPNKIFGRSVLDSALRAPEFLLYGGHGKRDFYKEPCWPQYQTSLCFLAKAGSGTIGVWSKADLA